MPSASASENSGSNRTYSWRVTPRIYRSVLFHALEVEVVEGRRPVGELLHRFRHGGGLGELVVLHRRLVRRELDDGHELPCVVAVPAHHCPRRRALACSLLTELVDDLLHVVELRRLVLDDLHETCHACLLSSIGWWAASMATNYPDASSAWRRSATRSSALSMPTDSRTSAGSTASGEPAADACVISAGCSISDSTAPRDSASVNSRVDATSLIAASSPAATVNDTMPPKSRIWRRATSWPGCVGRPGYRARATAGCSVSSTATARAFSQWRSMRTARVLMPRSTR